MTQIDETAIQAFTQRFARGAFIAPVDAAGLSTKAGLATQIKAFLAADPERRDADMTRHTENVLRAYGRDSKAGVDKAFPYAGGGIALLPVHGVLLNRFNYATADYTGYNAIRSMLNAAKADADVSHIVMDVNSFGGQAAGMFELAADIRAARAVKPITAIVDSYSFSAAYGLSSAASKIILSPSAEAGSIGVVSMHMNIGPALKAFGIEVTYLYAGAHKVDGNPFETLSESARANIQARIDALYGQFTQLVADGRAGKMTKDDARKTEARVYDAEEAVSLGLADAIMAPDAALASIEASGRTVVPGSTMEKEPASMSTEHPNTDAPKPDAKADERKRIDAILSAPEAKGRSALANHLALKTEMTAEAAIDVLKASPVEAAAPAPERNLLAEAMGKVEQPNLGATEGAPPAEGADKKPSLAAAYAKATGIKINGSPVGKLH